MALAAFSAATYIGYEGGICCVDELLAVLLSTALSLRCFCCATAALLPVVLVVSSIKLNSILLKSAKARILKRHAIQQFLRSGYHGLFK